MMDALDNTLKRVLLSAGHIVTADGDNIAVTIRLDSDDTVQLSLDLPPSFPYELPGFVLEEDELPKYGKLPHVGPTGAICAFDRETNYPNPKDPGGVVLAVLDRTKSILEEGIRGENAGDYLDEFLAYWSYQRNNLLPIFLLSSGLADKPKLLTAYISKSEERHIFVCDSAQEATALANRLGDSENDPCLVRCAYIPLSCPLDYPFPVTHEEWFKAIKKDGGNSDFYQRFLQREDRQRSIIIFSCAYADGRRVFAAFSHCAIPSIKGFRKGKAPLDAAISRIGKDEAVRHRLIDTSQTRLYQRGGNGVVAEKTIGVIGCGSLGSLLIDTFTTSGTSEFIVVDKEGLEVENIARHLCGFCDIGKPKAEAVRDRIQADNPNIKCNSLVQDAHDILDNNPELLEACSCIIVTVGAYPLEFHIIQKMLEGVISTPVVLMWIEPFALAAHALVLNKPQDVYAKMFDEKARFRNRVVLNGEQLFKREAGCQSTFVQYSGMDVKAFTIDFVRSYISGHLEIHNYHFAWYGALSKAGEFGATISPAFEHKKDYSCEIQRID